MGINTDNFRSNREEGNIEKLNKSKRQRKAKKTGKERQRKTELTKKDKTNIKPVYNVGGL